MLYNTSKNYLRELSRLTSVGPQNHQFTFDSIDAPTLNNICRIRQSFPRKTNDFAVMITNYVRLLDTFHCSSEIVIPKATAAFEIKTAVTTIIKQ